MSAKFPRATLAPSRVLRIRLPFRKQTSLVCANAIAPHLQVSSLESKGSRDMGCTCTRTHVLAARVKKEDDSQPKNTSGENVLPSFRLSVPGLFYCLLL